ncbi:MAG: hypothetical protein FJ297_11415 [Planctomycetes bacterium]|nr:hypothetical protein [Planctomycetota bacterium]
MRRQRVLGTIAIACLLAASPVRGQPSPRTWPIDLANVPSRDAIAFCLYTTHADVLKLTAQLYPLADGVDREVRLQVHTDDGWIDVARTPVSEAPYGFPQQELRRWTAHFRVQPWDTSRDQRYRVVAAGGAAEYEGRIRRDPVDKDEIVVAAFTGNSSQDRRLKPDLVANIKAQDPDLLFFSGDQSYDHKLHYQAWLLFGRQFGDVVRDRPTICIPDDHDIGQANLWGENGVAESVSQNGADGGYFWSPEYVNSVQDAQTWHLPDPYDPTPIQRGIGVFYTSLRVGRVGFAIIEDRKFKTGPAGLVPQMGPRPDHITDPKYDRQRVDLPDARLLGERQHAFLREWGADWRGQHLKAVLSQTVFANAAHLHGKYDYRLIADLDSNGWPQSGRNRALEEIRRFHGFMIGGDQHLATVIHHGTNAFGDSGYSFCVPSIVNFYNRWWIPDEPPERTIEGPLPHLGDFFDGFGNKVTMHAYANPDEARKNRYGGEWGGRADGHGLVRFHIPTRKITIECWPRGVDVTRADAEQYPGWPITIDQTDNYGRQATAWLPTVRVSGMSDPVIAVIDETYGDLVYSLRIPGTEFRPKVFRDGSYTIQVGEQPDRMKTIRGVRATIENTEFLDVAIE